MARPGWEPTEEERRRVRMLVGLGLTQEQIGHVVDKSVDSLARHCRQELDAGRAEMIAKVAGNLVQKALSGDTTCAIFYLKTQAGWRETQNLDLTHDFKGLNVTIGRRPDN